MKNELNLSMSLEKTQVEGRIVTAHPQVLEVEIFSPYSGIRGKTILLPDHVSARKFYINTMGRLTETGRSSALRVLEDIYRGAVFVEKNKTELLDLYLAYRRQLGRESSEAESSAIDEKILYALFSYLLKIRHQKISYDIFQQLAKKILPEV